ncbi:MAG: hypothetical protein HRT58_15785 [Crocinitomicaceae bacterium]|nr:hypothetical protein [Flavobacteriales bacterium]NQZ37130.1 hypothetical protein [Crocinitomicaceae bacterium]
MKIKQAYIQLISDAIIPLAGALFFNWSLYFILIFYCIDLLALEVVLHLKSRKTIEFRGINRKEWHQRGLKSAVLFLLSLLLIHFCVFFIQPGIDFQKELVEFMAYEEMGIQQGYILVPLIAFAAYQLYRMTFLMPARFRTITMDEIWNPHLVSLLIVIAFSGIVIGLSQLLVFHELVYILGIVGFSSAYQIWRIVK